jgi:hypothetical protein
LRRSILAVTVAVVMMFALAGFAADDPKSAGQGATGGPVTTSFARFKAASDSTADQLLKDNGSGVGIDSQVRENSGNVFLSQQGGKLYFWPGTSGSYISGANNGGPSYADLMLHGTGGYIYLANADTIVNGYKTGLGNAALTVNGSDTSSTTGTLAVNGGPPTGTPILYVRNDGNVGIGTSVPATVLHVKADVNSSNVVRVENVNAGSSAYAAVQFTNNAGGLTGAVFQNSTANTGYGGAGSVNIGTMGTYPFSIITQNTSRLFVLANGNVGIGVPQVYPLYATPFEVAAAATTMPGGPREVMRLYDTNGVAAGVGAGIDFGGKYNTAGNYVQFANIKGVKANALLGDIAGKMVLSVIDGAGNFPEVVTVTSNSMSVTGSITATGSITGATVIGATYQDVAEWVPATTHMEPGTVVVLNRERNNEVMPSAHAYDTAVAGVVSAQPGIVLGVASDSKAQIATTGRVKVHVDATAGAIAIGDLLVTSDKTGTAMKSQPIDIGGVQFHRPGTVIGKALEPLPDGQGEILVLLSLQ